VDVVSDTTERVLTAQPAPTTPAARTESALPQTPLLPADEAEPETLAPEEDVALIPELPPVIGRNKYLTWMVSRALGPGLFLCDMLALAAAAYVVHGPIRVTLLMAFSTLLAFHVTGMYRSRLNFSVLDDLPTLVGLTGLGSAASIAIAAEGSSGRTVYTLLLAAVASVAIILVRAVGYQLVRSARRHDVVTHRALVLGAGRVGIQLGAVLINHPEYGLRPVGFLDSDPLPTHEQLPMEILGDESMLAETIRSKGVHNVLIAFSSSRGSDMVDLIRTCDRLECEIFTVPRLFELHNTGRDWDEVGGIPLIRLRRAAFRSATWQLKRLVDIVAAGLGLLALAPVLLACAMAVRSEGGPGFLFRQVRVGLDGRSFELLKFRSMRPANENDSQTTWNISTDSRVGKVGRFLRKTSLDELPQLWNVLRGQMSLVGPRPERPHFVDEFTRQFPRYTSRHRVPAGLTGWAQIHGLRGDTSILDRARYDNYYIENWSLWLDIKIILRTVASVIHSPGG
jgi:exopolysaccharide biosynthesis polyprenyl glycosylphosphotransferase